MAAARAVHGADTDQPTPSARRTEPPGRQGGGPGRGGGTGEARRRGAVALDLLTQARAVPGHERAPQALAAWRALAGDRHITRTGLRAAWPTRVLARFDSGANLALSADGRTAAVRLAHTLHVLDVESGERGPVIEDLPDSHGMNVLKDVQFTADGRTVLTANADGSLDAWSVATGTCQASLRLTLGAAAAQFTADGRRALVCGADHRVRLWEMATGTCLRTLDGDHGWSPELWLAPDDRTAATGGAGDTVQLWDLDTGRCLRVLRGHTAPVTAICADLERRLLLSCGGAGDGRIRLWDTESGACLRVFEEQPGHARAIRLTPDGRFALSAAPMGTCGSGSSPPAAACACSTARRTGSGTPCSARTPARRCPPAPTGPYGCGNSTGSWRGRPAGRFTGYEEDRDDERGRRVRP